MIENIRLAFQGIWSHMMRSFLTMLGIIIGIASIIAIVSTIKGTSEQIKEDLIGAGSNTVNIYLYDGDNQYDTDYGSSSSATPILSDDVKESVRDLDHVENATFFYSSSSANIYNNNNSLQGGSVYGIDVNYLNTCGYVVQSGRGFITNDYKDYSKVALIDDNAAQNLFPSENPVGKTVEINEEPYTVVGVIRQDENYQPTISDINEYYQYMENMVGSVMIPDTCWPISFKFDVPQNAVIKADSTDNMSTAGNAVADAMNEAIPVSSNGSKSSMSYKADDIMKQVRNMQKLSESTNNQLIWIASISLLVGGIGVMNIMLVSVTERTKDIGLKKAIGARKKTILGQFLTEASVLTSIGGIIGVMTGIGLSKVVGKVTGSPTAISIPSIVIAVLFSTVIGVVFGLLPSVKAANLNPIDALRSE